MSSKVSLKTNPLLAILAVLSLLGCGSATESHLATSHLAKIKERGKITMLCVPHQESAFVKTNLERGPMKRIGIAEDFQGVDIDILKAFADHLGLELEVRPAVADDGLPSYGELIPALLRGEGDIIASSVTITAERDEQIDFSIPYFTVYPAVVVHRDSSIQSIEDLAGKKASALPGSSQEHHLRAAGIEEDNIVFYDFQLENFTAILEGEVDFSVQDSHPAERIVREYDELKIIGPISDVRDHYGLGVPNGSDLVGALDLFLEDLKESGELERILARYELSLSD